MIKRTAGYISLLLALLMTSAVAADDRDDRGRYDDRYDDDRYDDDRYDDDRGRYDDRHDRDDRYDRYHSGELRQLATELESLTSATYREARDDFHGTYRGRDRDRSGRTNEALADLNRLDDRARAFHREVTRKNKKKNDRWDSEREFRALDAAFREASISLSAVRPERDVRRLWSRVDDTMDDLGDFYEGSRYSYWRGRD